MGTERPMTEDNTTTCHAQRKISRTDTRTAAHSIIITLRASCYNHRFMKGNASFASCMQDVLLHKALPYTGGPAKRDNRLSITITHGFWIINENSIKSIY